MRYVTSVERFGIEKGIQQGIQQGRAEGRAEERAEMLLRLLRRRFGVLPSDIEKRVRATSSEQRDEWLDRLMDTRTLAEVFGDESD